MLCEDPALDRPLIPHCIVQPCGYYGPRCFENTKESVPLHLVLFLPALFLQHVHTRRNTVGLVLPPIKITVSSNNKYLQYEDGVEGFARPTLAREAFSLSLTRRRFYLLQGNVDYIPYPHVPRVDGKSRLPAVSSFYRPFPPFLSLRGTAFRDFSCPLKRKLYCARTRARSRGENARVRKNLAVPFFPFNGASERKEEYIASAGAKVKEGRGREGGREREKKEG